MTRIEYPRFTNHITHTFAALLLAVTLARCASTAETYEPDLSRTDDVTATSFAIERASVEGLNRPHIPAVRARSVLRDSLKAWRTAFGTSNWDVFEGLHDGHAAAWTATYAKEPLFRRLADFDTLTVPVVEALKRTDSAIADKLGLETIALSQSRELRYKSQEGDEVRREVGQALVHLVTKLEGGSRSTPDIVDFLIKALSGSERISTRLQRFAPELSKAERSEIAEVIGQAVSHVETAMLRYQAAEAGKIYVAAEAMVQQLGLGSEAPSPTASSTARPPANKLLGQVQSSIRDINAYLAKVQEHLKQHPKPGAQ